MPKKDKEPKTEAEKSIHPYSRKAKQIHRATLRTDKIDKSSKLHLQTHPRLARLQWFFDFLPREERKCLSNEEVCELIEMYLTRHEVELDDLRAMERGGRPRPPKVDIIEAQLKNEVLEYEAGFELPDLTTKRVYELFGKWNGDLNGVTSLTKRKFKKSQPKEGGSNTIHVAEGQSAANVEKN